MPFAGVADFVEGRCVFGAFDGWVEEYLATDSATDRTGLETEGLVIARDRRAAMLEAIVEDPSGALARAVPAETRNELPEAVLALLEEPVSGIGDFWVSASYGVHGASGGAGFLRGVSIGESRYRGYVGFELAGAASMRSIHIEGVAIDGNLAVRGLGAPAGRGDVMVAQSDEEESSAVGQKRVLVMRGTFSNMSAVEVVNEAVAYQTVEEVHRFLRESSYQQLSFQLLHVTEEVVVLPGSSTGYLPQEGDEEEGIPDETPAEAADRLMLDAMAAADAAGYLNEYDLVLAVFPAFGLVQGLSGSDAIGAAIVSGPFSFLLIESGANFVPSRVARLFAHNLGLWRSHYWKPIGPFGSYPVAEGRRILHGNPFDLMGGGTRQMLPGGQEGSFLNDFHFPHNHFSANFKNILGWLPDANVHTVADELSTATYRIFRQDGGGALHEGRKYSIRLLNESGPFPPWVRGEDEEDVERLDYWIDFRRMPFADNAGGVLERVRNGVIVQWGDGGSEFGSHLINAHPDRWPVGDEETPLAIGETFYDPFFGLLVTPAGRGGVAPDEYINLVVTRGTLDVELRSPVPAPSAVNPDGLLYMSLTETVEFAVAAAATGSPLAALELWVSGELVKTSAVSEADGPEFIVPFRFVELGEGEYEIQFVARNQAGNSVGTEPLLVSVRASRVDLSISTSVVQTGQEIRIQVLPDSPLFEIGFAEFFVDGELVGTSDTDPFEVYWVPEVAGVVGIQARVIDVHSREFLTDVLSVTASDQVSSLGRFWIERESGTTRNLEDVVFTGETFVAVGANGTIIGSEDGEMWSQRSVDTSARFRGVAYGDGRFVAVGDGGTIFTSNDSLEWERQDSMTEGDLRAVAYGSGIFVAVGGNGRVRRSADGGTWSAAFSGTGSDLNAVAWGGNRFVAVGETGTIVTSETGATWTVRASGGTSTFEGIGYGAARFVAVGRMWDSGFGGFRAVTRTSVDGAEWVDRPQEILSGLYVAHHGEGLFGAAGAFGTVALSADGAFWRPQSVLAEFDIRGMASGHGQYIAVGQGGRILQSVGLTFEGWLSSRFSPEEIDDPDVAAPGADPWGVGVSNLMSYALGIDEVEGARKALPRMVFSVHEGVLYPSLEYRRLAEAPDLQFTVERSTDLGFWQTIEEVGGMFSIEPDGNLEFVTARDGVPLEVSEDRLYLRLRVEQIE